MSEEQSHAGIDWDAIREQWQHFKEAVHERWEHLTEKDKQTLEAQPDHLIDILENRYGITRAKAETDLDELWTRWLS